MKSVQQIGYTLSTSESISSEISAPSHLTSWKKVSQNLSEFANTSNFLSDIGLTECKFLPVPQKSWWSYNL